MANKVSTERSRLVARLTELDDERKLIIYAIAVLDRVADVETTESPEPSMVVEGVSDSYVLPGPIVQATSQPAGTLERLSAESQPVSGVAGRYVTGTYDVAVRAVLAIGRPARIEEIVRMMEELGWRTDAKRPTEAARAALSRAKNDGRIQSAGYGQYAPPAPSLLAIASQMVQTYSHDRAKRELERDYTPELMPIIAQE